MKAFKRAKRKGTLKQRPVTTYRGPKGGKTVDCLICKTPVPVAHDIRAAVCGTCVARVIPPPVQKKPVGVTLTKSGKPRAKRGTAVKKVPSGRGRGWHLKKRFVDVDGTVYSFGKVVK